MANFNITVKQNAPKSLTPYIITGSGVDDLCSTSVNIYVPVPANQTRFIEVRTTGQGGTPPYTLNINTDTIVSLEINGAESTDQSQNVNFTVVALDVRINSNSDVYYSRSIIRQHTNIAC